MLTQRTGWIALVLVGVLLTLPLQAGELKGLKKDFRKALAGEDTDRAGQILDEIGGLSEEGVTDALFDLGVKYANTEALYDKVIANIRKQSGYIEQLTEKVDKGKYPEKVLVCDVVKGVENAEAVNLILPLLEDSNQFVQVSCVQSLEKSMRREAIGPLIELYAELTKKKTKDVIYFQVADSLFNLTGHDFELIADWRKWWEPVAGTFDPKATDTGGDTKVVRKKRGNGAEFAGIPVESKNVCFVIDTSGTMKYVHKDDIPGLATADGSDSGRGSGGGGLTPENKRLARFWTRMEMAKRELVMCIRALEKGTVFNTVYFDTSARTYKKKAQPSTPGGKKNAIKHLEDTCAQFWQKVQNGQEAYTNTLDALIHAFKSDREVNTIFFLSDGLPSKDGKNIDPTGPILDKLFELNKFRKVKIHTFGIYPKRQNGQAIPQLEEANRWLKELAKKTGGKFKTLKVDTRYTPDDPYGDRHKRKRKNETPLAVH